MKKLLIICLCFTFFTCISQETKKYDIHIFLGDNQSSIQSINDTLTYQLITLKNQKKSDNIFVINQKGRLSSLPKARKITGVETIILEYKNLNSNNPVIVKERNKIQNILTYPSDFNSESLDSIHKILRNATNIYIIEDFETFGYVLLKKVKLRNVY